ncbi:23S rRNA (uracil(1939)-C(5))-methyltransferase RlmD [Weissella tructae]|uniref:23S rRNA (Uracil-5-)-methyltransferase RumA n=2 Tax=Weissella TaxID=46255 RepID=A0A075U4A8_9LACO|nr:MULTISPECIES: 23S rRNA (uracil(1939)-C(5))-methyltransferase RlmD [Weissella]AIG64967.1 23S rRNA (Uracil-5-)-methyltransferase RumA [Weissella tructae]AIM62279.1 23S rRNA (Uracil-5-)-methyltransferase RumA [Weissella ceti]AIM63618.1 23S rRNA (Uracil-5-)-methyltransferase RumA [Weissella ceti]ELA07840.1 tRNA (uracil-5-)-methyltransferase-like protein [Weissella ceti NC36]QVV91379.1 23S rRNA (uracil(1939)-C(5))-methyltransferase RlmD [Weissella tructae]
MRPKVNIPVKMGEHHTGVVQEVQYNGQAVVLVDEYPIHLDNAYPNEEVTFEITQVNRKFARAVLVDVVTPSVDRVDAGRDDLLMTGIAPYINLAYPAQLQLKQQQVEKIFERAGVPANVAPTIGMEDPTHYRNKTVVPMQYRDGKLQTGFIKRGTPDTIVPLDDYFVNDPVIDEVIGLVRDVLDRHKVSIYSDVTEQGEMRYIMVRRGYYTHETMVVLVTQTDTLQDEAEIAQEIAAIVPGIKSIVLNHNPRSLHLMTSGDNRTLWGADAIHDQLLGIDFEIGPNSFYQVNPQTTEVLYALAAEKAKLTPNDTVIDAYSGIGTIGLSVANQVKEVIGVEWVARAVEDAEKNVANNEITNARFVTGDAPAQMKAWHAEGVRPEVVFVDPTRPGLTPELMDAVVAMRPTRFVYISCNPETMARDARYMLDKGFVLHGDVQPLDQFPQTAHVETVAVFVPGEDSNED